MNVIYFSHPGNRRTGLFVPSLMQRDLQQHHAQTVWHYVAGNVSFKVCQCFLLLVDLFCDASQVEVCLGIYGISREWRACVCVDCKW